MSGFVANDLSAFCRGGKLANVGIWHIEVLIDRIRPAADVLRAFLRDHEKAIPALLDYGDRLDNGAVFKRLSFLLESEDLGHPDLVAACRKPLRSGYVKLDASIPVPQLATAWGLWVPKRWATERSRD